MDVIITNLSKTFGSQPVLQQCSATLPAGETTLLTAPSGAGKTTLLRILAGLETPDRGTIDGLSAHKLSMVFQEDRLCPQYSAAANLRLINPRLSSATIAQALSAVGLPQSAAPVSQFSGGMARRVALLRALLVDATLILLDEPFKGLDAATKDAVLSYTKQMTTGKTVLLATHDPSEGTALGSNHILTLKKLP